MRFNEIYWAFVVRRMIVWTITDFFTFQCFFLYSSQKKNSTAILIQIIPWKNVIIIGCAILLFQSITWKLHDFIKHIMSYEGFLVIPKNYAWIFFCFTEWIDMPWQKLKTERCAIFFMTLIFWCKQRWARNLGKHSMFIKFFLTEPLILICRCMCYFQCLLYKPKSIS